MKITSTKPSTATPKVKMQYPQAPLPPSAKVPKQENNPARRNRDYTPPKSKGC